MTRSQAREIAFKCLFGQNFLDFSATQNQWKQTLNSLEVDFENDDLSFVTELCQGVMDNFVELKNILNSVLKGYVFDQLYSADKTILLLAVYEIKHTNVDAKVAINEAVKLSKKYGLDKSSKFVNGVLAGVLKIWWMKTWLVCRNFQTM